LCVLSVTGGATTKKPAKKLAAKPRKKGVLVVPRPKSVGRTVGKGIVNKSGLGKGIQAGKAGKSGSKCPSLLAPPRGIRWLSGETAVQRLIREEVTKRGTLHIPTDAGIIVQLK
jgi:ribosome modulation factor